MPSLPTRERHLNSLRRGIAPNVAPTATLSQVLPGRLQCVRTTTRLPPFLHAGEATSTSPAPLTQTQTNTP
jgi:hypothetical protein